MGQQQDQGRNQKILWIKWKWGEEIQNLWDTDINPEKFIALQAYLKNKTKQNKNNKNLK